MLTTAQKEERRKGIGASDVPAICGLNPWKGPIDVWREKMGLDEDDDEPTEAQERGNELEDALLKWMGKRTDRLIALNTGPTAITFQSKEHELVLATPDGLVVGESDVAVGVAEVKSPGPHTIHDWENPVDMPDGIPAYYLPQVVWQMHAVGVQEALVGALVGGRLWVYRIGDNEELFRALLHRAEKFWFHVEHQTEPPVDDSISCAQHLIKKFPIHKGEMLLRATNEMTECAYLLAETKEQIKVFEKRKTLYENMLKEIIGDAPGIKGDWGKVLWKNPKDTITYDMKRLIPFIEDQIPEKELEPFRIIRENTRRFSTYFKKEK